jgi:hypothetical protein
LTDPKVLDIVRVMNNKPLLVQITEVHEISTDPRPHVHGTGRRVTLTCGHETWLNATMMYRPGETAYCYHSDHHDQKGS